MTRISVSESANFTPSVTVHGSSPLLRPRYALVDNTSRSSERSEKSTPCIYNEACDFSCLVSLHSLIVIVMSMTANEPDLERGLDGVSLGLPF